MLCYFKRNFFIIIYYTVLTCLVFVSYAMAVSNIIDAKSSLPYVENELNKTAISAAKTFKGLEFNEDSKLSVYGIFCLKLMELFNDDKITKCGVAWDKEEKAVFHVLFAVPNDKNIYHMRFEFVVKKKE